MLNGYHKIFRMHGKNQMKLEPEIPNNNLCVGLDVELMTSLPIKQVSKVQTGNLKQVQIKTMESTQYLGQGEQVNIKDFPTWHYIGEEVF